MKKIKILSIIILLVSWIAGHGQKLEKNEIDKFTKKNIKETSWEKLTGKGGMSSLYTNFRISKIDTKIWFELKMMMNNEIYSINENDQIIFLFENDSTITLFNNEAKIACKGCGSPGFVGSEGYGTHTYYELTENDIANFKRNKIIKVRVYNSDSFVEGDAEKVNTPLRKCFELIEN